MEALTPRKQAVLDTLDETIEELEKKLKKYQPFFDELNTLKQTRRVLLSERATTGGGGAGGPRLTMEEVITVMRANAEATGGHGMEVSLIAEALGYEQTRVRSHLNRYRNERYERNDDGTWSLIGEESSE